MNQQSSEPQAEKRPGGFFHPILAGATLRERVIACVGALLGISLTCALSSFVVSGDPLWPLIAGPLGASAVLIFAVPASPLAQPWPVVGGNTISAVVGVTVAHFVGEPVLATGTAVALAILVMSLTRSLHPPGGATALTAVIGGPAVVASGYEFALMPIALNAAILVCLGYGFHKLTRRSYPHVPPVPQNVHKTADPPPEVRVGFNEQDIDSALASLNETFDISRDDLGRLLRQVEQEALARGHGDLLCANIMSRDVVSVGLETTPAEARDLLLRHDIRALPVLDRDGKLAGIVGLRELLRSGTRVGDMLSVAATAAPDDPALGQLPVLTSGRTHAVVIVDADRTVLGLLTQTDLLAAVASFFARRENRV